MYNLTETEKKFCSLIVDCAFDVHQKLGPGLLEKIYETCFCHELKKRGLDYRRQAILPVIYDGIRFDEGLRLDVIVEDLIICELKSAENEIRLWQAQLMSYLKLSDLNVGFIINFNVPLIKNGIRRICMSHTKEE